MTGIRFLPDLCLSRKRDMLGVVDQVPSASPHLSAASPILYPLQLSEPLYVVRRPKNHHQRRQIWFCLFPDLS